MGQEKEGELAITSLEFEYLHRKNRCEMLIGGDDISNDVITLGACFLVFFNVCLHLRSFPLCADWRNLAAQSTGSHRGIGERVERVRSYKLSFLFPPRRQSAPESLLAGQGLFS